MLTFKSFTFSNQALYRFPYGTIFVTFVILESRFVSIELNCRLRSGIYSSLDLSNIFKHRPNMLDRYAAILFIEFKKHSSITKNSQFGNKTRNVTLVIVRSQDSAIINSLQAHVENIAC